MSAAVDAVARIIRAATWLADEIAAGRTTGLISSLAEAFELSRPTASRMVKELEAEGYIVQTGSPRRPDYRLGENRLLVRQYALEEIDEDLLWVRDFRPFLDLRPNVMDILHHGFTEMMNNIHDHSGGRHAWAWLEKKGDHIWLIISDDGIGIFERIATAFNLPDRRLALLELSKGKLTTDPDRHSGEGIFFTSRMFDHFAIEANGLMYEHAADRPDDRLTEVEPRGTTGMGGTAVHMVLAVDSERTTREIFEAFTLDRPDDLSFNRTVVPVRLARLADESLVSRSQGKRLVARFEGFRRVELDFTGVDEIGQAFADEVFRVFVRNHPEVELVVINATDYVGRMIRRVQQPG